MKDNWGLQWHKYLLKRIALSDKAVYDAIDGKPIVTFKFAKDDIPPYDPKRDMLLARDRWGIPTRVIVCREDRSSIVKIPEIYLEINSICLKRLSEMTKDELNGEGFMSAWGFLEHWHGPFEESCDSRSVDDYNVWEIHLSPLPLFK